MSWKEKIKKTVKNIVEFCLNPRLLLCFGIGWLITNGWSYILLGIGTLLEINWMIAVAGSYLALLWVPFTPEKLITVIIAIFLLKLLFPNDQKTLKKLIDLKEKAKQSIKDYKAKKKPEEN